MFQAIADPHTSMASISYSYLGLMVWTSMLALSPPSTMDFRISSHLGDTISNRKKYCLISQPEKIQFFSFNLFAARVPVINSQVIFVPRMGLNCPCKAGDEFLGWAPEK
jgi:hypothetical protein